jgi:hypothetical protein
VIFVNFLVITASKLLHVPRPVLRNSNARGVHPASIES